MSAPVSDVDHEWLQQDADLRRFTTIGTGGCARFLAKVERETDLQQALEWARRHSLPVAAIGLGSNTLVADEGFAGLAVRLAGELAAIEIDEQQHTVRCGGGASLAAIVRRCRDAGLAGFEFGCAIPGTVGGAVKMNAGAYGGEMCDVLVQARITGPDGTRDADPSQLEMGYRHSNVAAEEIVTSALLQLQPGDPALIKQRVREMQASRSETQPRAARSFGSVFRNPEGHKAGALIESVGLKGHTIGGACISPKHGNFIENLGEATTADVIALIQLARETVREATGVVLQTEVHLLGHNGYRSLFGPPDTS